MRASTYFRTVLLLLVFLVAASGAALAQLGSAGSIHGTVVDQSGGVVPDAVVEIRNPVSGYRQTTKTDVTGEFLFVNIPPNPYHLSVSKEGFQIASQDVEVRSSVPVELKIALRVKGATETVTVEASSADLLENTPLTHTDVDRTLFEKLPLESPSSSLSSLVTLASPGIAADSNGLFHGLGDHAENSFSVDGQPITDQQSKVFSNQIPVDSIQSLEVIAGAPPAEYGDKTSLVIVATTRSGQGLTTPHGSVSASYGSFGTGNAGFDFGYGGRKWGNFVAANGLQSGRFLDPPEFVVMHDKGNQQNVFDRVDYQPSSANSFRLNLGYTRSWFQNPNSFDQQFHPGLVNSVTGSPLGLTGQRSQIRTFNIAPTWTRLISSSAVFTLGGFVRKDYYNYYPSADLFNDLALDLQSETIRQDRGLTNAGVRSDASYVKGSHNLKAGVTYQQTFLTEDDSLGIVDPTLVPGISPSCLNATTHQPMPGTPCAVLAPFDLTGGGGMYARGGLFTFHGHTDVKELALYVQDAIKKGSWSFSLGVRGDLYHGISSGSQAEPRFGVAYNIKPSSTVLRLSYARTLETPFNENLVIASTGCSIPFLALLVPPPGVTCNLGAIQPGWRNEFHAGLQQAFGKYLVVDAEYIWKYTHNGYDFGIVGSTPIAFPIEWHNSKVPGYAIRTSVPDFHGFTAFVVMSGVAARFFLPQVAGLPIIPVGNSVFRIDHDELFNQTTHLQYQPWKRGPWFGFNWRYDSGLVSGAIPCLAATATCAASTSAMDGGSPTNTSIPTGDVALVNAITGLPLTADQQYQAGLVCNGVAATPATPTGIAVAGVAANVCPASQLTSNLVKIPAPGTENDDHKPQRIRPRSLFDLAAGHDNLFHGDRYKWSVRFTVVNLTNKLALYNFLSTFSGTHYVTPRTFTGEIGFSF